MRRPASSSESDSPGVLAGRRDPECGRDGVDRGPVLGPDVDPDRAVGEVPERPIDEFGAAPTRADARRTDEGDEAARPQQAVEERQVGGAPHELVRGHGQWSGRPRVAQSRKAVR